MISRDKLVWVEEDQNFRATRIFKNRKSAVASGTRFSIMLYKVAVYHIRRQCWLRCEGFCELCGDIVTESSGQLHEQKHRGKGGEISLENSVFICAKTHKGEHADREPKWSKHDSR